VLFCHGDDDESPSVRATKQIARHVAKNTSQINRLPVLSQSQIKACLKALLDQGPISPTWGQTDRPFCKPLQQSTGHS
jgi:hypothetical protein